MLKTCHQLHDFMNWYPATCISDITLLIHRLSFLFYVGLNIGWNCRNRNGLLAHVTSRDSHRFPEDSRDCLNIQMSSYQHRDPMLKIRRSRDSLIFNMGIHISGKMVFILRWGPDNPLCTVLTAACLPWGLCKETVKGSISVAEQFHRGTKWRSLHDDKMGKIYIAWCLMVFATSEKDQIIYCWNIPLKVTLPFKSRKK